MPTPATASAEYKRQISEISWARETLSYYVADSDEAAALSAELQNAEYMYTKVRVARAVTGITGSLVTGDFAHAAASTVPEAGEVYIDQFIRFDESLDGSNYTRWYKVRQFVDNTNIRLYETLPAPGGTYQGYQIGRLIWRRIMWAPGEYNVNFLCIPGLAHVAIPGTAKLVELPSALQPQFLDVSENIFFGLDFYPNEIFDSLDGWLFPLSNMWAGVKLKIDNCRVRYGAMGDDHIGGYLQVPMFTGGTTSITNCEIETAAQVAGQYPSTEDVTGAIMETRLKVSNTDFIRVGDYASGATLLGANQFHAPANATTIMHGVNLIWDELYVTANPSDGVQKLCNILVGDFGGAAGAFAHSQNAKLFARDVYCKLINADSGVECAAVIHDEATATSVIDNSQFEIESGNTNAAALLAIAGTQTLNNVTIISEKTGAQCGNGSDVTLNNCGAVVGQDALSVATGSTCTINGGSYEGSNKSLNILFGTANIGKDVVFDGPVTNVAGTLNYLHSGVVTLNGATPVAATLVDAALLTAGTKISLSRVTAGGTLGHYSITARVDGTGFSIVGQAGDTSTIEWSFYT